MTLPTKSTVESNTLAHNMDLSWGLNLSSSVALSELNLTDEQHSKLRGISAEGVRCYLQNWLHYKRNPIMTEGLFCEPAWDEIYCWPPTKAGENVTRPCSVVMRHDPEIPHPEQISGDAFRICGGNGSWEWSGWTNYSQCLAALEDPLLVGGADSADPLVVNTVRYILFVGSILSVACIAVSLFIFYYFKSLRCDRITLQIQLMVALLFRFVLLIIISEPFVFRRTTHYRSVEWLCKTVMGLQLYGTVAAVSWMFVQGYYLNARVTTNVFDRGTPFRTYCAIGWGIPLVLILCWVSLMELGHEGYCWRNYGKSGYVWILVGPMVLALGVNFLFLVNIMRVILTKIQLATISSDSVQLRAVKATILLFPLLGVTNLLFAYNPGGKYEAAYMITNTILQASQGVVVSTLYCFWSKEVRDAIRREYRRYSVKRSASSRRSGSHRQRSMRSSYANSSIATNSVYWCERPTSRATQMGNNSYDFPRRASSTYQHSSVQLQFFRGKLPAGTKREDLSRRFSTGVVRGLVSPVLETTNFFQPV